MAYDGRDRFAYDAGASHLSPKGSVVTGLRSQFVFEKRKNIGTHQRNQFLRFSYREGKMDTFVMVYSAFKVKVALERL